ncbi:MAG: AbrB/MazE/SpoVT family DNA-binding domain-containing protein [Candidatus Baldrarchaeia archaeon]
MVGIIKMSREVVLNKTKIGKYCRTTVPDEVRKLLEIGEGDMIEWIFNGGKILVRKASG